ncbi:4-alpha-L-fucosyltransferase [Pseudoalteromonas sp. J010]|uniref:TDP-N-acetylfucosamine:lipid II N-acetylfucosaminyltransferase n=1 Tax=Pseudoalteromonas sp. J010 TaxID=998465 RepID=UPI000F6495F4|nr:TDP-N-acetylfucosamine:lipid II N-acetylfucosaminyltransferase [Pseudoalteromonas sp. J010]RRS10096.1 4-alpha-L-fucosyltransferase [Pseudoalteromonas sp. J010]
MLVHIFSDTPHHYQPMMAFYERCFDGEQAIWVLGSAKDKAGKILFFSTEQMLFAALQRQSKKSRFIFHGLFSPVLIRKLALSRLLSRSICVLWGAEIYRNEKVSGIKNQLNWFAHRLLLNRVKRVFTLNSGDADLVKRYMRMTRKVDVLPYPLIDFNLTKIKPPCDRIKILMGNSADPANNHKQLIDQLAHVNLPNIDIYAPLNYGGALEYVEEIKHYAQEKLKARFYPITKLMTKEEYDRLLCEVDMSLFAHHRQQGLYVVYAMLLQGKPMYLNTYTSTYHTLTQLGFRLFDIETFSTLSVDTIVEQKKRVIEDNVQLMRESFTESALAPKWDAALKELMQ